MFKMSVFLCYLMVVITGLCEARQIPPVVKPAESDAITCNFDGQILKINETYAPADGSCMYYTCHGSGNMSGVTCADFKIIEAEGWTYVEGDKSKPYPECCDYATLQNSTKLNE
ncbi:uncharacterized protein LOC113512893 [Galleria mellonella]|uniref:Uncharacterized protein LOC113512893 n=1 Tax=Galleria mellonella TaxID=7137 RepID=A0A6J1WFP4_GALME|nr:uncharacterized protein LOC113512893 [Galleria mellonella]